MPEFKKLVKVNECIVLKFKKLVKVNECIVSKES